MTARELDLQRSRVKASLSTDDLRETHRAVYPIRTAPAARNAVLTSRRQGAGNTHRTVTGSGWKVRES